VHESLAADELHQASSTVDEALAADERESLVTDTVSTRFFSIVHLGMTSFSHSFVSAAVIEIYFMFMILCLCSKQEHNTLASTVGAIVQYCLRNHENPHISVHL